MMNIVALASSLLMFAVLAVFAVLLPVAIVFNVRAGELYREKMAGRIEKLRLGRMLGALDIDIDTYISRLQGVDIHTQMERCRTCTKLDRCDESLAQDHLSIDDIGFCSNRRSLAGLAHAMK